MFSKIQPLLGYLIAGLLLFVLIDPFVQARTQLNVVSFEVEWWWLILSFGLILLYRSLYVYPFSTLLRALTQRDIYFRTAFTLFHLSNIMRYLPGRIWGIMRLLSLSHRFGLSKTDTASSLTLHVGIETALGGLLAMTLMLSKQMRDTARGILEQFSGHTVLLTLAVIGLMTGILFCIPKIAEHARQFLKTLTPLLKTSRLWRAILTVHSLLWICQGFAFFLYVKSLFPVRWADAEALMACFAFAWIVGFLSFLTPGGLGIREGLLGLLLANYMPAPQATLVALLCRLWMLSAEILLAGVAFLLQRHTQ